MSTFDLKLMKQGILIITVHFYNYLLCPFSPTGDWNHVIYL